VSHPVYLEFLQFVKIERSLRHGDERYREYSELSAEALNERALRTPKNVEDEVFENFRNEELRQIIQNLPKIQRRRFILRYDYGHQLYRFQT
jgi:DNA-directed RNA polymerase specialized sigma24 family protein